MVSRKDTFKLIFDHIIRMLNLTPEYNILLSRDNLWTEVEFSDTLESVNIEEEADLLLEH